jgi:hypothetical protein
MRSLIMLILFILSSISLAPAMLHSTYERLYLAVFRRLPFAPGFSRRERGHTISETQPALAGLPGPLQQKRG